MTFTDYWKALQEKNPGLRESSDTKMTLPIASFRRALEQAFNVGCEQGRRAGKVIDDVFKQVMGGK